MVASFNPPTGINQLEGAEVVIDDQETGPSVSCWWNFSTGAIRASALTAFFVVPTDVNATRRGGRPTAPTHRNLHEAPA